MVQLQEELLLRACLSTPKWLGFVFELGLAHSMTPGVGAPFSVFLLFANVFCGAPFSSHTRSINLSVYSPSRSKSLVIFSILEFEQNRIYNIYVDCAVQYCTSMYYLLFGSIGFFFWYPFHPTSSQFDLFTPRKRGAAPELGMASLMLMLMATLKRMRSMVWVTWLMVWASPARTLTRPWYILWSIEVHSVYASAEFD